MSTLLDIRDLRLAFNGLNGLTEVLHGVSLHVDEGERVALVGESGSGKSVTARIVLGLLQDMRTARVTGQVTFGGQDIGAMSPKARASNTSSRR